MQHKEKGKKLSQSCQHHTCNATQRKSSLNLSFISVFSFTFCFSCTFHIYSLHVAKVYVRIVVLIIRLKEILNSKIVKGIIHY